MWLTVIKSVTEIACVVGSEVIVGGIVKNIPANSNKILAACSKVATVCVAGVLGTAASKYADEQIDEIAETIKKASAGLKKGGEPDAGAA